MSASIHQEVTRILRERHAIQVTPGLSSGLTWFCSCGARSAFSPLPRTETQKLAGVDRHLRAQRVHILRELMQP
jgi:hypothetical protein